MRVAIAQDEELRLSSHRQFHRLAGLRAGVLVCGLHLVITGIRPGLASGPAETSMGPSVVVVWLRCRDR
jgi:hypothetical protein